MYTYQYLPSTLFIRDWPLVDYQALKYQIGNHADIVQNLGTKQCFIPSLDLASFIELSIDLDLLFKELREHDQLNLEDLFIGFAPLSAIDRELYETIGEGLKAYWEGKYLSATYILTLQTEELIRQLVRLNGKQTTEQTIHGRTEKPLGRLIKQTKPYLDAEAYAYLYWVIKDYRGLNLRNVIAHGFLKKSGVQSRLAVTTIHVLAILTYSSRV